METKLCTECKELICSSLFTKKNAKCKPCLNKLWKIWYKNNKDKAKALSKDWKERNKEKMRLYDNEYKSNKRKTDPLYKMKCNIRSLIWASFKYKSYKKKSKLNDILGCSYEYFKEYIENKFTKEMNWNNIHIDHIKPLFLATTEEEVIKFNHYTNLQPLLARDNLIKSNKYGSQ